MSDTTATTAAGLMGVHQVAVQRTGQRTEDLVVVEGPLELRLGGRPLAVTLRTPGSDLELGLGFLLAEGVIEEKGDVCSWQASEVEEGVVLDFELSEEALDRWARRRVEREFRANSACGACGKPRLEDLFVRPLNAGGKTTKAVALEKADFRTWIAAARARQPVFEATGGCHAAASFQPDGKCLAVFEDVGRHNALDKLVGDALQQSTGDEILDGCVVLSTGRAGFEIVQKALRARASALVALGAATSMAVALASEGGLPLVSFAGGEEPVVHGS